MIEPLPNGLIVTKHEDTRLIAAECEVLIVLEAPAWPAMFDDMIRKVWRQITRIPDGDVLMVHDKEMWMRRLSKLTSKLNRSRSRVKRGLFNFIGEASRSLFGTATVRDVQQIRRIIRDMKKNGATATHRINELLLVMNHSNIDIQINRNRINLVSQRINKLSDKMVEIATTQQQLDDEQTKLRRRVIVDGMVSQLEREAYELHQLEDHYQLKKEHLEADRLTEEILPPEKLREIVQSSKRRDVQLISPIEWYYENTQIRPIWTGEDLVYSVRLALAKTGQYTLYEFKALPYPSSHENVTQRLIVRRWYLEEPMTGQYVQVSNCRGYSPVLCHGNLVIGQGAKCEHALVKGDRRQAARCTLTLSKRGDKVQQLDVNQAGLTTRGEAITMRCSNGQVASHTVGLGTYLITVPKNCIMEGNDWRLAAIAVADDNVTLHSRHVKIANWSMENITSHHVKQFINDFKNIPDLDPVRTITLKPLTEQSPELNDIEYNDCDSYHIIDLVLIVLICPPYILCIYFLYYKCKLGNQCRKSKTAMPEFPLMSGEQVELRNLHPTSHIAKTLVKLKSNESEASCMTESVNECVEEMV